MNIIVQIKTVYGEDKVYPLCANALIFAHMLGTKTLTESALKDIKALNYTVTVAPRFSSAAAGVFA
jgi:hypothetical protein